MCDSVCVMCVCDGVCDGVCNGVMVVCVHVCAETASYLLV